MAGSILSLPRGVMGWLVCGIGISWSYSFAVSVRGTIGFRIGMICRAKCQWFLVFQKNR